MYRADTSMHPRPARRNDLFLLSGSGLLALLLWTIPNWNEFWSIVAQFPTLWQIPANHPIIIVLVIKFFSPLCVMCCLESGLVLYRFSQEPAEEHPSPQTFEHDVDSFSTDGTHRCNRT